MSGQTQYIYDFDELDEMPQGPTSGKVSPRNFVSGKSSSFGAAITGETMHVGLIHKAAGTGSKLHNHPNEQFNFVLKGTLQAEIDGQTVLVPEGHVIHIPAKVYHSICATPDEDVIFYVVKDTRHGLAGPPVDGKEDGPRVLSKSEVIKKGKSKSKPRFSIDSKKANRPNPHIKD
ncbi:MAG: cupin domain-containing protein [Rhodospirillales bacterium]|jgi:quercetin dioxygenase-like cupin family protein